MTTPDTTHVALLLGSVRADSLNRRIAEMLVESAPAGVSLEIVGGLADLPFYNEELDGEEPPAAARALREAVAGADRVLAVTPEYNGTVPAVLSNAIDWLSRPFGVGAINNKPFAVVGATPTRYGGKWAHDSARRSAGIAGAVVVEQISVSESALGGDILADPEVVARFVSAVEALVAHEAEAAAA